MRNFTGVSGASGGRAVNGTRWTPEVGNAVVQELANLVTNATGGNTALDPNSENQVREAILAMIARAVAVSYTTGTYETTITIGEIIVKVGTWTGSFGEQLIYPVFETAFPHVCWGAFPIMLDTFGSLNRDTYSKIVNWYAGGFTAAQNFIGGSGSSANDGVLYLAIGR